MDTQIPGSLHVSEEAIADIVGSAVMECYGVVGMTPADGEGLLSLLPSSRLRRGVRVSMAEGGVCIDLYVVIEFGTNIGVVSRNLADRVKFVLDEYAKIAVATINVHVQDVKVRR